MVSARALVHQHALQIVPHLVVLLRRRVLWQERTHVEMQRVGNGVVRFEAGEVFRVPGEADEGEVENLGAENSQYLVGKREKRETHRRKGDKTASSSRVLLAIASLAEVPTLTECELDTRERQGEALRTGCPP
jgi:hypothetical protein